MNKDEIGFSFFSKRTFYRNSFLSFLSPVGCNVMSDFAELTLFPLLQHFLSLAFKIQFELLPLVTKLFLARKMKRIRKVFFPLKFLIIILDNDFH